ncbi:hypothetical protein DV735_g821, partial [Chaetothyriales sp. CBS 134920]
MSATVYQTAPVSLPSDSAEAHGKLLPTLKLELLARAHSPSPAAPTALRSAKSGAHPLLDEEGNLTSAGAATSLKHARAQDLPSFPSQGGVTLASASAAANLAEAKKKPFEHWKPGVLPAANKAALQAQDYEMDPLWQPGTSSAGSKAAILAHRDPVESERGSSPAVTPAGKKTSPAPAAPEPTGNALRAASGAMAQSRRRADSVPVKPQTPHGGWAVKAATSTRGFQTPSQISNDPAVESARVQNIAKNNVNRQLYGSTPPVAVEAEERNRQVMLRASAVAMAKKMYAIQQTHIDEAKSQPSSLQAARQRASSETSSGTPSGDLVPRYENLDEAARRLAQERLAKLHDEHAEYRQYYGANSPPRSSRRGLSLRNPRGRPNAGVSSDAEQSRRIRSQMSMFQSKLAEVDAKKRQADRDALLEIAHRNVAAKLNMMDEKVFAETGKASPQQRELWERQARERAQRESDERITTGRVHVGGGMYLDQSEIDAIARARLQPTLNDITEKAEQQRARDEETRLDKERQQREVMNEKLRQAEVKLDLKKAQEAEKAEAKERKAEEKRLAAAEKEKRQAEKKEEKKGRERKPYSTDDAEARGQTEAKEAVEAKEAATAEAATTGTAGVAATPAKVKSWLKTRFRTGSKSQPGQDEKAVSEEDTATKDGDPRSDSMRDVALAGRGDESEDMYGDDSAESAVSAIEDKATAADADRDRSRSISSVSEATEVPAKPSTSKTSTAPPDPQPQPDAETRGRRGFGQRLLDKVKSSKPGNKSSNKSSNKSGDKSDRSDRSARESTDESSYLDEDSIAERTSTTESRDEYDEARDTFEEQKLAPPAKLDSPRGSRERSRFTEVL